MYESHLTASIKSNICSGLDPCSPPVWGGVSRFGFFDTVRLRRVFTPGGGVRIPIDFCSRVHHETMVVEGGTCIGEQTYPQRLRPAAIVPDPDIEREPSLVQLGLRFRAGGRTPLFCSSRGTSDDELRAHRIKVSNHDRSLPSRASKLLLRMQRFNQSAADLPETTAEPHEFVWLRCFSRHAPPAGGADSSTPPTALPRHRNCDERLRPPGC